MWEPPARGKKRKGVEVVLVLVKKNLNSSSSDLPILAAIAALLFFKVKKTFCHYKVE